MWYGVTLWEVSDMGLMGLNRKQQSNLEQCCSKEGKSTGRKPECTSTFWTLMEQWMHVRPHNKSYKDEMIVQLNSLLLERRHIFHPIPGAPCRPRSWSLCIVFCQTRSHAIQPDLLMHHWKLRYYQMRDFDLDLAPLLHFSRAKPLWTEAHQGHFL